MNYSGIVVVLRPGLLQEGIEALGGLPGVEVHHVDAARSRVVVVQEAATVHDEVEGMKAIQELPQVADAALVYHYFGESEPDGGPMGDGSGRDEACAAGGCAPAEVCP